MDRDDVQGIQSIELGGSVLKALIDAGGNPLQLRDVAAAAGMSSSKARRYLLSLARIGLAKQDEATGYYELGSLAIRVGLAAISTITVDRVAPPIMRELRARLQETIVLAIWSDNGPTVLQVENSQRAVMLTARIGSTLPMTRSATGFVFGAFFDTGATAARVAAELSAGRNGTARRAATREYEERVAELRRRGVARVDGHMLPGVSTLSAPVFDHTGALVAGLGILGHRGVLDVSWEGDSCTELVRAAALLSERCGYTPPGRAELAT